MEENEKFNSDFSNDKIPISKEFWSYMENYWHKNREFPESTEASLNKKADLIDGKVPSSQLPSYVDDVLEFDTFKNLPNPGEKGKIYLITNDNSQFRWSGSEYIQMNPDKNLMNLNGIQSVTGRKSFITAGGSGYSNHALRVYSTDGSNPGITFYKEGVDVANIIYDGIGNFRFKNFDDSAHKYIMANGFKKEGSSSSRLLLGDGTDRAVSDFITAFQGDLKYIPYTGATSNININTRNLETTGRLITGNEILNLASKTIQGTGIIDIKIPNINLMGVFYIDVFTYGNLVGTFVCQFYTYYGSSIHFAGANSVTFLGKNSDGITVRYVTVGTDNFAERHLYIGGLNTNWGNWSEINIRGVINVGRETVKTNSPAISLITAEATPLNTSFTFNTFPVESAGKLGTARNINGTLFDGTADITTNIWGSAKNFTLGNSTKSVNGSGNVSWSLAEIGASPVAHTHSFSELTGKPTTALGYGLTDIPRQAVLGGDVNSIRSIDTRNTNPLPSTDLRTGAWFDFKLNSAIGLTGLNQGTYGASMTFVPYNDNSGNNNTAFRLVQSNNNLFFQNYNNTWGSWNSIFHSGNFNPLNYALTTHTHTFSSLSSKPTTLSGYGITDAISMSHPVNGINSAQINNWNSAFGWGNHAEAGYASTDFVNESIEQITAEYINPDYPVPTKNKINTVIITEEFKQEYLELASELIPERSISITNLSSHNVGIMREDSIIDKVLSGETTEYYITSEKRLVKKGSYRNASLLV